MIFVILWTILILILSLVPHLEAPSIGVKREDLIAHFFMYFILGISLLRTVNQNFKNIFYIIFFGILFGIFNEINQIWIPGRRFEFLDILSNSSGIILSIFFKNFFKRAST